MAAMREKNPTRKFFSTFPKVLLGDLYMLIYSDRHETRENSLEYSSTPSFTPLQICNSKVYNGAMSYQYLLYTGIFTDRPLGTWISSAVKLGICIVCRWCFLRGCGVFKV